ncbi:hypothetical protein WR25_18726 [Diploscapter pachys]|uniref:Uncharacterized protein n=1 Tax=Diploscapter pachys TaxID=2018661 RepID=A0A2A2KFF0_9BILA|nr:hypothetical protein WR25_18726 [Diploscapter pachys]
MAKSTYCGNGEQTFDTSLRAKFYAEHDKPFTYRIPPPLISEQPWIKSARINANLDDDRRNVVVSYPKGRTLRFSLRTTNKSNGKELVFCHHSSRISNFSGTIVLDTNSNWYLNLTLYNASGYINGSVKESFEQSSGDLYSFTEYAGSQDLDTVRGNKQCCHNHL